MTTSDTNRADLATAAARLGNFGRGPGRGVFSGIRIDEHTRSVTVFRIPDGAFDDQVSQLIPASLEVTFADARHSREDLERARALVWKLPGAEEIVALSVRVDGSVLELVVRGDAQSAQSAYDAALPGLVRVTNRGPRHCE